MWLQDAFLKWWLHGPRYGWSKFRRFLFERSFLKTPLPAVANLDDVQRRLADVHWQQDGFAEGFDCVSYPQRVWAKKHDDCDGFAVLAAALLNKADENCQPVILTAMVSSLAHCHSVCAFKEGTKYRYFSNYTLIAKTFNSYPDVVEDFKNKDYKLLCWDVVNPETLKQLEFHIV